MRITEKKETFKYVDLQIWNFIFLVVSEMGLKAVSMDDQVSVQLRKNCGREGMPAGEVLVGTSGTALPKKYLDYGDKILDMEVREDDVWVISFPKCGE
jgi:hypothetical protein